jgi:hypothetical protein
MKNNILDKIDELKRMVMLDSVFPEKTDVEKYDDYIDRLLCKQNNCNHPPFNQCQFCDPKDYAVYSSLRAIVENLFYKKYGKDKRYIEYRREVRQIIAETIGMTLFIKEESGKSFKH